MQQVEKKKKTTVLFMILPPNEEPCSSHPVVGILKEGPKVLVTLQVSS